jgi:hypothetical protein
MPSTVEAYADYKFSRADAQFAAAFGTHFHRDVS